MTAASSNNVDTLKSQGNAAFSGGDFATAISHFSEAIALAPENHVLFSNRSAAYAALKDYEKALEDADRAIELKSDWSKAYGRKAAALFGLGQLEESKKVYEKALEMDPQNQQLRKSLNEVTQLLSSPPSNAGMNPFSSLFEGDLVAKLASKPQLAPLLADRDLMSKLTAIQQNPKMLEQYISDPRVMQVIGALLGVNITTPDAFDPNNQATEDSPMDTEQPASTSVPKYEEPPKQEETPKQDEQESAAESLPEKEEAKREKELGNQCYKKKQFSAALEHYARASELDSTDISILNNTGAVHFELGQFQECIDVCQKAVDIGREHRAEFKHIARALGRIGSSYVKLDQLEEGIKFFHKSLSEFRTADVLEKLRDAEKELDKRQRSAYQDPQKAEESRSQGNELFKQSRFADAVPHYTEAIKRDESDPRAYSNRAACYTKLMALPEALKDAEKAIELDKTFVKAYIRKAMVLVLMREWEKCMECCDLALQVDQEHNQAKSRAEIEGIKQKAQYGMAGIDTSASSSSSKDPSEMTQEERAKEAMKNPRVQEILADPVMRLILEQMSTDPQAAQEHLKNEEVRRKIQVLAAAGVIGLR